MKDSDADCSECLMISNMAERNTSINIQRKAYRHLDLETQFEVTERQEGTIKDLIRERFKNTFQCSRACVKKKAEETFPFVNVIRKYNFKKFIIYDMVAGLSVGIVHIPQSMGFALLASLPPVYGLYCSFFQPLLYFLFAMSQHNSLGTMAVPSLIIGVAVERELKLMLLNHPHLVSNATFSGNTTGFNETVVDAFDPGAQKAAIATTITLLAGLIQLGMSLLRLGMVTTFMPASFIGGFTTACGFFIATSQIPSLFGIKTARHAGIFRLIKLLIDIFKNLKHTNPATFIVSVICLTLLIIIKEVINEKFKKKLKIPLPAELIVVILGTLVSYLAKLYDNFRVQNVGEIPRGFPTPVVPPLEFASNVITDAIVLAILSFVISISMANLFAQKYKYPVESNQEMMAYGMMHTVSSFFHCFGGACAPPRAYVFEKSGGRTSIAYLFSCALLFLVIMVMGQLFQPLPKAVLASVIIVALFPLFKQFKDLGVYWKISKFDFVVWFVTWFSTIITDVGIGLGIGVGSAIISYVCTTMFAQAHLMSPLESDDLIVPQQEFKNTHKLNNIIIFKFESNLYFVTVQRFKKQLFKFTFNPTAKLAALKEKNAEKCQPDTTEPDEKKKAENHTNGQQTHVDIDKAVTHGDDIKHIIIDCSSFTFIDVMGINFLRQLKKDFSATGVEISLVNSCPEFRHRLMLVNLLGSDPSAFPEYPTIQDALAELTYRRVTDTSETSI